MSDSLQPHGLYSPWNSPGQNTGEGSLSILRGIFPTQGMNPGLPHCRRVLYLLSLQGSSRILEWVIYFFSRSSRPRNWTEVSCIAGGFFFTSWATWGSPRILEWVAYPFSSGSSQSRDRTSRIAGGFFTSWATTEGQSILGCRFSRFRILSRSCCPLVACRVSAGQSPHSLKRGGGAGIPL